MIVVRVKSNKLSGMATGELLYVCVVRYRQCAEVYVINCRRAVDTAGRHDSDMWHTVETSSTDCRRSAYHISIIFNVDRQCCYTLIVAYWVHIGICTVFETL